MDDLIPQIVRAASEPELMQLLREHEDAGGTLSAEAFRLATEKLEAIRAAARWLEEHTTWRRL